MKIMLSDTLRDAIRRTLDEVEKSQGILDAYRAAQDIQKAHPRENVALEDIMAAMMTGRGSIQAIEFDPRSLVIELVYPLGQGDGEPETALVMAAG